MSATRSWAPAVDTRPFERQHLSKSIALPWGMNFWTPQTGRMGDGWQYTYTADKIRGFKQTHQPSPWMNDYGEFSIMPETEGLHLSEDSRASWFSHKAEVVKPLLFIVSIWPITTLTTEIVPPR